jgi:hypothetical protein
MATFGEICSAVLEESDGRVVEFSTTDLGKDSNNVLYVTDPTQRNVIGWVKQEYRKILNHTPYWSFLRRRGTLLKVKSGRTNYTLSIGRVRDYTLFYRKTGTTTRIPVYMRDYSWWAEQEQLLVVATGQPIYLVDAPSNEYIIWPTPNADGEIYGDWWYLAEDLSAASDEPIWAERYHDLLKWGAVRKFAAEFDEEGAKKILLDRVNQELPFLWDSFKREYFPSGERPCSYG